MPSNALNPSDWTDLVPRIRNASDEDVARALVDRERKFDNFFADFQFTVEVSQPMTVIAGTLLYAEGQRVGRWIHLVAGFQLSAAGPGNNAIRMFIPSALPCITTPAAGPILVGTFTVYDASAGAYYTGNAEMDSNSRSIYGRGYGGTLAMGAAAPVMTLANGDQVHVNVRYPAGAVQF